MKPSERKVDKDLELEQALARINRSLVAVDREQLAATDTSERQPQLFVLGAPRSGTTLLTQLIASRLEVGYINRLAAAFWQAPLHGIALSRMLLGDRRESDFESEFGRTRGLHEPHEFGYFWLDLLNYPDLAEQVAESHQVDWERVRTTLNGMANAFAKPLLHKTFLIGWHLESLQRALPRSCVVWIRRERTENARSLLRFREWYHGSHDPWVSVKPAEFPELKERSPAEQVAGQVHYLERSWRREVDRSGFKNLLEVDYETLCEEPDRVLQQIQELLAGVGARVDRVGGELPALSVRRDELRDPDLERQLAAAFKRLDEELRDAHRGS